MCLLSPATYLCKEFLPVCLLTNMIEAIKVFDKLKVCLLFFFRVFLKKEKLREQKR